MLVSSCGNDGCKRKFDRLCNCGPHRTKYRIRRVTTDFWWDQYLGNTGNCWHDNKGKYGNKVSVTSTPPAPLLPAACDSSSIGTIGPEQEPELLNCLAAIEFDTGTCPWFTTPSKP